MTLYPPWPSFQDWVNTEAGKLEAASVRFADTLQEVLAWPDDLTALPAEATTVLSQLGVEVGDYVILPNFCPDYWASAIRHLGAEPILVDIDPKHWQIDLDLLEEFLMNYTMLNEADVLVLKKDERPVRSVIATHLLGVIGDMQRLQFIARRFHLTIGEDISAAIGSKRSGRPAGSFGQASFLSFTENGILPFGQSLMLFRKGIKPAPSVAMSALSTPGQTLLRGIGEQVSRHLSEILGQCRVQQDYYRRQLEDVESVQWIASPPEVSGNVCAVAFATEAAEALALHLRSLGIPTGRLPLPLSRHPAYQSAMYLRREDHAGRLFDQALVLPAGIHMNEEDTVKVVDAIQSFFRRG